MKPHRTLFPGFLKLNLCFTSSLLALLAATPASAVNEIWDGGGGDNNIGTAFNWQDNTAPVSDIANTDLIFAGIARLTPNFNTAFSARTVTFINTAGAFTLGGNALTIGTGGIINSDGDSQVLNNPVTIGAAGVSFNAATGLLAFNGSLNIGSNGLTVTGAFETNLGTITGSGTITKTGPGQLNLAPSAACDFDLVQSTGTVRTTTAATFSSSSNVQINGGGFTFGSNVILDGAAFSRGNGATIAFLSNPTLTLQNAATFAITGPQSFSNSGTINVTGGSQLTGTSYIDIGTVAGNTVNLNVSGATSLLDIGAATSYWGGGGGIANVTFSNGATGDADGEVDMGSSGPNGGGLLNILSGARATFGTSLKIGVHNNGTVSAATIDGSNSKIILPGGASFVLGAPAGPFQALTVQNNGVFDSGTGAILIDKSGVAGISGGQFLADGHMTVNGSLNCLGGGSVFTLAPGKNLTVQNGGDLSFGGRELRAGAGSTITFTGAGTTYDGGALITAAPDAAINITADAHASAQGAPASLQAMAGTVTVDGDGSYVAAFATNVPSVVGSSGQSAVLTVRNDGDAFFDSGLEVPAAGSSNATGTVLVESGAFLRPHSLHIAATGTNTSGTVTVTGRGDTVSSVISQELWAGPVVIGKSAGGNGALNIQDGAVFFTTTPLVPAFLTMIEATGSVSVTGTNSLFIAYNSMRVRGQLTSADGGRINTDGALVVENGGDALFGHDMYFYSYSPVTVTGSGSTLSTPADVINFNNITRIESGGVISSGAEIRIGDFADAEVVVDGAGSQFNSDSGSVCTWGGAGNTASVTFRNDAAGNAGNLKLASAGTGSGATLAVESGADLLAAGLGVADIPNANTASVNVGGPGSTLVTGATDLTLGAASSSSATLNIAGGGAVTVNARLVLNATGTVNLDGGSLTLINPIQRHGGAFHFTAGALTLAEDFAASFNGLLGANPTLGPAHRLTTLGATLVTPLSTLTIDGGTLTTGGLSNSGLVDFRRGTLAITGGSGFVVGSGGGLGSSITLGPGASLAVTAATSLNSGALITMDGGSFSTGSLTNDGGFRVRSGVAAVTGAFGNNPGAQLTVTDLLSTGGTLTNSTGGRVTLLDGAGTLFGAGSMVNNGLVTGDGTIAKTLTNNAPGEIRAENGKTIFFTGPATNSGQLNLLGGTLDFSGTVTNSATGFISGRGALFTGGLTNSGQMAFAGGFTDIRGDVTLTSGSRVVTSGAGAVAAFYDDVVHNGAEIFTGAGAGTVFFGSQSGSGSYTGSGTIYFMGDLRPGSSPASISFAPQVIFDSSSSLTLEIGGTAPGTQHDKLTFTSAASPQIMWGGTLVVEFINGYTPAAGHSFDIFDFDAARDAGAFATLTLPSLPAGLSWDTMQLYTTGVIGIIPGGLTFSAWATSNGIPGALPVGDHDSDGYDNGTEFALGLFPPLPGTVLPDGGLFTYPDGERLRILFTRPLDRSGVTLKVQGSRDLTTWSDLAVSVNSAPFTGAGFVSENRAHPLSEPGLVEVRDILNASGETRRYLRLQVTLAP